MPEAAALLEDSAAYVEKHKVFQLFEQLLQQLLIDKPDQPIDHLIRLLKREDVPRIVVAGPPGAQTRSLCELLAAKTSLVHVIGSELWREMSRLNNPAGLKAKELTEKGSDVPDDLMLEMLKEKLTSADCISQGWVLEGFPSTASQARGMLSAGLLPTRFLHVTLSDAEVLRRLTGRRVDPKENTVYHLQDAPPPDEATASRLVQRGDDTAERVTERLGYYRQDMEGVFPLYSKVLKDLDGTTPGEAGITKLLEMAIPLVTSEMPTRAPRGCPRVLLLGGPGSDSEALGAALAQRYSAKFISAVDLLHAASLTGNKVAKKAMETPDPLKMAEGEIPNLVLARLQQEDVRTQGFVMTGFPQTMQQANFLKKKGIWVRHAVHLELTPKEAEAAVMGKRHDPFDGEEYHVDGTMPADPMVQQRLVAHPNMKKPLFKSLLKGWQRELPGLLKSFSTELLIEDAKRPQIQLVERLAPCFLSL